jgi:DNA-binding MarR family transcriptional regulator
MALSIIKSTVAAEHHASSGLEQARMQKLLGYNLAIASATAFKRFDKYAGSVHGLRRVEFTVLVLIDSNPDVTAKKLGNALGIAAPNMTVMLDRLEKRELLRRVKSEADGRAQHVILTRKGRALAAKCERAAAEAEEELLKQFTPAERATLFDLLQRVGAHRRA